MRSPPPPRGDIDAGEALAPRMRRGAQRRQAPVTRPAPPLHYVTSDTPGIRRYRRRGTFVYLDSHGRRIVDAGEIARIRRLAIPPAYRDVWICADPDGHLQATGRDARGRKQYRYHPAWVAARDAHKYGRMRAFGRALPKIRAAIDRHLARPGLAADKVMATVVSLLDRTLIRIGNARYMRENASFGLTTLRDQHVTVNGNAARFRFRGKSGIEHRLDLDHPRLARILKRCQDLPGQQLFQFLDAGGHARPVRSDDINAYLKTYGGNDFSAKDYRTWAGSAFALALLRKPLRPGEDRASRVSEMVAQVANLLGNTRAVCRKCYIHPDLFDAFLAGKLDTLPSPRRRTGLRADEAGLLAFLESRERASAQPRRDTSARRHV